MRKAHTQLTTTLLVDAPSSRTKSQGCARPAPACRTLDRAALCVDTSQHVRTTPQGCAIRELFVADYRKL
jgi:hypothetical protein